MSHLRSWGSVCCVSLVMAWAPGLMAQQNEPPAAAPPATQVAPAVAPTAAQPAPAVAPGEAPPNSVQASPAPVNPASPAPEEPPPPLIQLQHDAPPPPPVPRKDRVHDGFYARLNLGFGALGAKVDVPGAASNSTADGDTLAMDVAVGYSPSPGIVVGGQLLFESLSSADFDGDVASQANVSTLLVGPFFDGYPRPRGGFHLGGAVGFAQDRLSSMEVSGFKRANGFGISGWVGYDQWVAEQWSVGGLVRLMGTRTSADAEATSSTDAGNARMATQSIHLMLTVLYH